MTAPTISAIRSIDLCRIRGQEAAKRALEVAAAGGHHLLMIGPPGAGKTMLARALPTILAPLLPEVEEEVREIYRLAGAPVPSGPPIRAPDPGTSRVGILGCRHPLRPGEASLASGGVLVLDELPDFSREALAGLKEPLAERRVRLVSQGHATELPARFQLMAAAEPCACGRRGDRRKGCRCTAAGIRRHWRRIPDALLDRIDLHIEVPALELGELRSPAGESSAEVCRRVVAAREVQARRTGGRWNAELVPQEIRRASALDTAGQRLLDSAFERLGLSARMVDAILRVSRTIADLAGCETVRAPHLAEAIQYRSLDRSTRTWLASGSPAGPSRG